MACASRSVMPTCAQNTRHSHVVACWESPVISDAKHSAPFSRGMVTIRSMAKRSPQTATKRMNGARRRTEQTRDELMAFIALLTRMYPAHQCEAARAQDPEYSYVVCVHTPAGQLAWKLSASEALRFA